ADSAFAIYKKTNGTPGVIFYYFDRIASDNTRERIKKYADLFCILSPDAPKGSAFSVMRKGLDTFCQGFVVWNAATRKLLYENRAYRGLFGYKNAPYLNEKLGAGMTGRSPATRCEEYTDAKGRCFCATHTLSRQGSSDIVTTVINEITKYKQAENKLNMMAKTDALTGLLNRRAGLEHLKRVYKESKDEHKPLTVCFADIDGLKYINDNYGHGVGDSMIRSVADVLRKHIGRIGAVCRLGGDEFILILPGMNKVQAALLTAQIDREAKQYLVGDSEGISMSFGFKEAEYKEEETADTLISIADIDMYREKRRKSAN
ncbi:MAG: GGDEF domain-containing protein, partial [Eubacteriales bacterium]|nr:GGDEF domain-containing protein [Eubacteriales bacterium]